MRLVSLKLFFVGAALFCILQFSLGGEASLDNRLFKLGSYELNVPQSNMLSSPGNVTGGDDSSRSALFIFSADEVKKNVPSYAMTGNANQFKDDIEGMITALTKEEVERYRMPSLYRQLDDLWYATGSYKDRVVESQPNGMYKVYRKVEYPHSWSLLKKYPDNQKLLPSLPLDFWVAHCLQSKRKGSSAELARCDSYILINDLLVEFDMSASNLNNIDEIRVFLASQVNDWIER